MTQCTGPKHNWNRPLNETLAKLQAQALKLSSEERAVLVHRLIESIWESGSVKDAWVREVGRRCAAIDSGEEELLTGNEVIRSLRQKLSQPSR
jgi:putative addiction module component (TIGR02574 family)